MASDGLHWTLRRAKEGEKNFGEGKSERPAPTNSVGPGGDRAARSSEMVLSFQGPGVAAREQFHQQCVQRREDLRQAADAAILRYGEAASVADVILVFKARG